MEKEQIKNNFDNNMSNDFTYGPEAPKSFEEHMAEIEGKRHEMDQSWKADIEQAASEYEITEYDRSILASIDSIEDENDKELALIAFSIPFAGFKNMDREHSYLNGIENLAIDYAKRSNKNLSVTEYFKEKYGDNLYDLVNEPSRTKGIMELEDAERYISTPQEKRNIDGEYMFEAYALELSKHIFAKSKDE